MSIAREHLGLNLQPSGGFTGLGTSPLRITRSLFAVGSGIGIEEMRAIE